MNDKKKLIFCTYSSIYSSIVLQEILNSPTIDIVAIVNSTRIIKPRYGLIKGSLKQIQISGWRYSTYLFLVTDIFSWLQLGVSPKKKALNSIHKLAKFHNIPILNTNNINDKKSLSYIQQYSADFLLAAHFNQLIKSEILNLPKLQCLNIHPSLLPAFKGVDPVFYATLKNQNTLGVSLHQMAESFDTGKILLQESQLFKQSDWSLFSINCHLFKQGSELAIKWINNDGINLQQAECINTLDNYDSWPSVEAVTDYSKSGKKLINIKLFLLTIFSGVCK